MRSGGSAPSVAASAPSVAVSAQARTNTILALDCAAIGKRMTSVIMVIEPHRRWRPQYYIHYADFNRRLDEWVLDGRLHPPQPSAVRPGNERKRKLDPAVASCPTPLSHAADEAAAGELDAATQREHEAATRVKNINAIQLGKWQIQTWCVIDGCPSAQQRGGSAMPIV